MHALDRGHTLDELRGYLHQAASHPVPQTVTTLLDDTGRRAGRIRDTGQTHLIECADEALAALIISDRRLRVLCTRIGERHLAVSPTVCRRSARPPWPWAARWPDGTWRAASGHLGPGRTRRVTADHWQRARSLHACGDGVLTAGAASGLMSSSAVVERTPTSRRPRPAACPPWPRDCGHCAPPEREAPAPPARLLPKGRSCNDSGTQRINRVIRLSPIRYAKETQLKGADR
ncbi:helicase-associated domain-containing protein [Streptomyces sp. NPDC005820]|uniref:helicase-associated domain-containing protein n=1 Tax=Streptomyces sp. NPDC005820 TaxID=3157069 RepID=UPI0033C95455